MDASTVNLLCTPRQHEAVRLDGEGRLRSESGAEIPLREGIPVFLDEKEVPRRNKWVKWMYNRLAFAYEWR